MVDIYQPEPFEQRKSQNLTFWDYARQSLFWGVLPGLAGLATFAIGRIGKYKLFPLDGSPTIVYSAYEKLFHKSIQHVTGTKMEVKEIERLYPFNRIFSPEKRLQGTRDMWNFLKGFEVGVIPAVYHLWRNKEQERLDIVPVVDRLKQLKGIRPEDEELQMENAALKKQLAFSATPQARISAQDMQHEGKMEESSPELVK